MTEITSEDTGPPEYEAPRPQYLRAVGRICLRVARNPSLITTVAPYALHPTRSSWEAGEPWWNRRAIRHVNEQLPPSGEAFEWGSGGSTVWLTAQGLHVTAIESELEWAERVSRRCPSATVRYIPGTDTGTMRSEPQLDDHGRHFFDDYVAAIDDVALGSLDVVVIDGICRVECARRTTDKVKPGGMVVLDDTNLDFLAAAAQVFAGWRTVRLRGFKRRNALIEETACFRKAG